MRGLISFLAITAFVGSAHAQTGSAASTAAAAQGLGGPVVPGVCLLSRQAVLANAKVAQAATARLRMLTEEAQQEINVERKPIDADVQAFNAESSKLSADQRAQRQQALQARLQPVEMKTRQRAREIDATREKALQRITAELQPVVAQIYKQRGCGLLVERDTIIAGNMTNDLTQAVTQGLDAKIATISFNRETLPADPAFTQPAR